MPIQTRKFLSLAALAALAAIAACSPDTPTTMSPQSVSLDKGGNQDNKDKKDKKVCEDSNALEAQCHAHVLVDDSAQPFATSGPSGYGPADLQAAYSLSPLGGAGQTIAIVDAFDDPNAESDLAVYRAQFGLPPCTTANKCFRKVNQNGGTSYPKADMGWAEEISLDLDMASAICPNCKIILVEANTNSFANLAAAVNRAAALGANAISNSYGGGESASQDESAFNHPGIAITVSSGDAGYGAEFPASSQYVTAVGGTTLTRNKTTGAFTETAWSGAGSGCSAYVKKPSWQKDAGCPTHRTVSDVSAVADPYTGVAVYDSYRVRGWLVFGGTSVSSPIVAGIYALAGNAGSLNYGSNSYSNLTSLNDIVSGSNGSCGKTYPYLCTAGAGYDGPTGNGTPKGTGAF